MKRMNFTYGMWFLLLLGSWASSQAQVDGGVVLTEAGEDTTYYCVAGTGGAGPVIAFDSSMTMGSNFQYVVTDAQGIILGLPPADMVDFAPAGPGECWVWGLSYEGTLNAMAGDDATTATLATGNFDLSDDFVVVFRDSVEGGMVMTESGEDTVYYCVSGSGGPSSAFKFDSMMTAGPNFTYVVTDNQGTILALPGGDMVDVGPAGVGECWVWGLSYTGNVLAQAGDNAAQVALTDGCYDLSDNYVVTFRDSVEGGMVSIADTATQITTCPTDGEDDILDLSTTGVSPTSYQYVVTDDQGSILALPPGPQANLEGAGQGICRIYGLAHTGDLMAQPGMDVNRAMATGCYQLSENFITVDRDTASCSTTGLFNVEQDLALSLRPVPATDRLTVSVELPSTAAAELRIVNLQGQTLHAERIAPTAGPASVELSVTELPAGIYLLDVRSEGRRGWARFSKE